MNANRITPNNGRPTGPNPNNMRPATFGVFQPHVDPMLLNFKDQRTLARPMHSQIGMYSSTEFMSHTCHDVNNLRTVTAGKLQGLSFNQSDVRAQPPSWKMKGIFVPRQRLGNLGADIGQTRPVIISVNSY